MGGRVTCVVPTRNRASLLARTLRSVSEQTYRDVAVVVVDDSSTDDTGDVVRAFDKRLGRDRITYIRHRRPRGAAAARNVGISSVETPYVAFLDDDDEWLPDKIEAQVKHLSTYPLVGTRIRVVSSAPASRARALKRWFQHHLEPEVTPVSGEDLLVSNCGMSPSSVVASTSKVRQVGGFDETLSANQGRDFLIRFALEHGPVLRLNRHLVVQHQEHELGRISERGEVRFDAMETVHQRYRHLMPTWLRRYDRARIDLQKARMAQGDERRVLERKAFGAFDPAHPLRFIRLYLGYLRHRAC